LRLIAVLLLPLFLSSNPFFSGLDAYLYLFFLSAGSWGY
jgi:hypothetical protein